MTLGTLLPTASATGVSDLAALGTAVGGAEPVVLQTAVGGSQLVVLLALAGLLLAAGLSLVVVYKLFEGYRRNGTGPMLVLAVGLALLVTGPIFLRLAFANLLDVSPAARSLATTASELLGLAAILYAIYEP
ncbi:hypothetical protein [Halorussus salinus]|uniref:hypothetical protein n=1 Tax=Halorussus salinus TaxID=1364935 RepID=UPI001EE48707|nr:hypothetical protein [Halorussus salinus]